MPAKLGQTRNVELLGMVIEGLIGVMEEEGVERGVGGAVKRRCLVDVLAGCGELAFLQNWHTQESWKWNEKWNMLVNRSAELFSILLADHTLPFLPCFCFVIMLLFVCFATPISYLVHGISLALTFFSRTPTTALLQSLLPLLHPLTPNQLQKPLINTLSTLPLRPHAIRHILQLFLSQTSDTVLAVDALANASRIICAVPTTVTPETYFANVCPQLLECLDGKDVRLARAAGFVVAELLGKSGKAQGPVEREIVEPIVAGLSPSWTKREVIKPVQGETKNVSSALLALEDPPPLTGQSKHSPILEITDHRPSLISQIENNIQMQVGPLVPEKQLTDTLHRLSILFSSHPSPAVPQRLVTPILLPLWALISYAKTTSRSTWYSRALALLKSYIKTTTTTDSGKEESVPERLQKGLLFTGDPVWEFGPGAEGGIEIRPRANQDGLGMDAIEARVEEFLALLDEGGVPEGALNTFFLSILRVWLGRRNGVEEEGDPVRMFTTLKILQEMLLRHSGVLAKAPTQTLQIVSSVLGEYVDYCESLKGQEKEVANPTLGGLGKIVHGISPPSVPGKRRESRKFMGEEEEEEEEQGDEETERNETVVMALSLLSVLISQPGTKLTEADERLIQTLNPPLQYISSSPGISIDLSSLAINIASLLALHEPTTGASTGPSPGELEKESYVLALSYLRDPLIPVRAHGLHLLWLLIMARAAVVDVVGTMRLLIGMLKDGDSFVYLNVVKCLSALTERHSKTVTRMLVESYVDDVNVLGSEEGGGRLGLDERLRIGEALLVTVQRLGSALVGETADVICESMLGIISRRRIRKDGEGTRGEEWGSDPEDNEEAVDMSEDPQVQERKKAERVHKARIIKGWHPKNSTEDLRIRTSALSILGAAIETNAPGLGPRILTEALSTSLSILTLETAAEKAILRRAAVVCIGSVLRSLVGLGDDEKDSESGVWRVTVWDVLKNRVGEVRRVLGYVRGSDNDGLVREQTGVVADNLEAVVERWVLGGSAGGGGSILGGGLRII